MRIPHLFLLFAFVLLILAVVPACGDDDDDDSTAGNDPYDDDDDLADDDDDDITDDDDFTDDDDSTDDDDAIDDDDDATDDDDDAVGPFAPHFIDDQGREVIIHGVNYMGLEFGFTGQTQADFDQIAQWGFTHVRLPISWAYMETEEGVWNTDYLLNDVEPVLDMADNAGLKVFLDMHQWQWCSVWGGNGSPSWACEGQYDSSIIGMIQYSGDFWTRGLDRHWKQAWELVWDNIGDHPAIWGYDLFNEPYAGVRTIFPFFEQDILTPFYQELIDSLRTRDTDSWVLVEPSLGTTVLQVYLDPVNDLKAAYAPHIYTGFVAEDGVDYWFPPIFHELENKKHAEVRQRLGIPLLVGEYGITSCTTRPGEWTRDAVMAHDRHAFSETVWVFWKSECGWSLLDAAGNEKSVYLDYLERPYPRAVAGYIESFGFDFAVGEFNLTYHNSSATGSTVIYVPQRHFPNGFFVVSTDPDGAWNQSFDAATRLLTIEHDPVRQVHTINIARLEARTGG